MVQENIHRLLPTLPLLWCTLEEPERSARTRIHLQEMWSRLLCRNWQREIQLESLLLKEAIKMMTCWDCELLNQCPKGILFQGDVLTKDVSKECDRFIKGELDDEL